MLRKGIVLLVIGLFFGAGIISNVIGDNLSGNKLNNKELIISKSFSLNTPPVISEPFPLDGAVVDKGISEVYVTIEDPDGDTFDWSIETSPNVGYNSGSNNGKITAYCSVSNLVYATTYYWYVNASDGTDTTRVVYSFTTGDEPPYIPTVVEIYIEVVETIRGAEILLGIVNKIENITEWDKQKNQIRVKWYIENEKELNYQNSPLIITSRTREYQEDSAIAELLWWFTEGGRITTNGHRYVDIVINITTEKSSEGEQLIDVYLTELDDMIMFVNLLYLNFNIRPFFMTRGSVFHIKIT
jgi:hypothetical protein